MVYFPDGRPIQGTPTGAGIAAPLAYTPGRGQNPTANRTPPWDGTTPWGRAISDPKGPIRPIVDGLTLPYRQLLEPIARALRPKPGTQPNHGGGNSPVLNARQGERLVVIKNGQIVAGVYGPSALPFNFKIENPAIQRAPGRPWDGKPVIDSAGKVYKRAIVYPAGGGEKLSGLYDERFEFALVGADGSIAGVGGNGGGYRPGLTNSPGWPYSDPDSDGLPDSPFDNPNYAGDLADLLRDLMNGLSPGGFADPNDGSGGKPDEDGDGKPDEDEDKDKDSDEKCKGKHPLAILKATADKIYLVLGGDLFGNDKCDAGSREFELIPEAFLRNMAGKFYDVGTQDGQEKAEPQSESVTNWVELMGALLSVGYIRSGQHRYPSQVVDSIMAYDPNLLDLVFGRPQRVLIDQQAAHQWQFEQLDAILGKWHQTVKIPDADLEEQGNQELTIRLPNLAESVADLYTLVFDIKSTNDVALNFLTRLALEQSAVKKETIVTQKLADTILDYLGPKTKEVKAELPILFTLLAPEGETLSEDEIKARNNISTILEPSKKPIVITELAQPQNLQSDLNLFRRAEAIVRASLAVTLAAKGVEGVKNALIDNFELASEVLGGIDLGLDESEEEPTGSDFSEFLSQVESGFIATPGISDNQKPYGRPQNQRPRVREIGNDQNDS